MTFIWRAQRHTDKIIMHIQLHYRLGQPLNAAICGVHMEFNRSINAPFTLGRPICRNCLRSCLDERIAA